MGMASLEGQTARPSSIADIKCCSASGCFAAVPAVQTRVFNLDNVRPIRDLDPVDIDSLVAVRGMVTRSGNIIPDLRCAALADCIVCALMYGGGAGEGGGGTVTRAGNIIPDLRYAAVVNCLVCALMYGGGARHSHARRQRHSRSAVRAALYVVLGRCLRFRSLPPE